MKQIELSKRAKISNGYLSQIINRDRYPSWPVAKRLASATCTTPILWLEGTTLQIRSVLAGTMDDPFRDNIFQGSDECRAAS